LPYLPVLLSLTLHMHSPDMHTFSHPLAQLPFTACSCTALSNDCFHTLCLQMELMPVWD